MSTLNVVRYTALVSGILYGFVHLRTLNGEAATHAAEKKAKQHQSWVEQAKKEYAKKKEEGVSGTLGSLLNSAAEKVTGNSNSVISDPEDPKFDLEKLVAHWEKQAS